MLDVSVSGYSALLFFEGHQDGRTFTMSGLAALQPHNLINKISPVWANCPIQSGPAILAPTALLPHDSTQLEQKNSIVSYRENTGEIQGEKGEIQEKYRG